MNDSDIFLKHYGVAGMKWGVRRKRKGSARSTAKKLSDTELKKRVNRLEMEKKYVTLTTQRSQSTASKGASVVGSLVANAGKRAVADFTAGQFKKALEAGAKAAAAKKAAGG